MERTTSSYTTTPILACYRLDSSMHLDEEKIWAFVQQHGGHLSIRGDCIDFWIPREYQSLFVLAWSSLRRKPEFDYI
jgi:hypothetical protein